jgi:hypothetical protein
MRISQPREDGAYIILNPPGMEEIQPGDALLVVAEDDDSYDLGALKLTNCGAPPDYEQDEPSPSKTLLIGWRRDIQDMVIELDKWVAPGSGLTMLSDNGVDYRKGDLNDNGLDWEGSGADPDMSVLSNVTVSFLQENPIFKRDLLRCNIEEFDSILVLTETRPGSEGLTSDSRTMITTLLCRHIQKEKAEEGCVTFRGNNPNSAIVIPEISDPRTAALLGLAKAQDFIVSGDLISMALGQMSEQADIHQLLADLFSCEGNEMHIKDVRLYVTAGETLSFWEIMNRARQRCEVSIGYHRPGMEEPIINPANKSERITWRTGDMIVVIAED